MSQADWELVVKYLVIAEYIVLGGAMIVCIMCDLSKHPNVERLIFGTGKPPR